MPYFPFVVVGPCVMARELCTWRPLLFRVIILVASFLPAPRKRHIKNNVMAIIGHYLLVQEKRELDLLQGLLVYIAW